MESKRPPNPRFSSSAVEGYLVQVKKAIKDPQLAWLFENCYPNTLDTTVFFSEEPLDTYVITGDIEAMWLRDSTAQVWPYLPLMPEDAALGRLFKGLISRQARCVLLDPYANAFYRDPDQSSPHRQDRPAPGPGVHERKWELDSLCYVIRLAYGYYQASGDLYPFDAQWRQAMERILQTLITEQRKGPSPYWFERETTAMLDAPPFRGTGHPIRPVGLIASMFRPSDDSTLFPFHIPSNIFATLSLGQLAEIFQALGEPDLVGECERLAGEVARAVREYGVGEHLGYGSIYAYEVDGYGNKYFFDYPNIPSLLSLPYLGHRDPLNARTRRFLLSSDNPFFFSGRAGEGLGSPHTGKRNIWPMGIILRALTSTEDEEIRHCLGLLKSTHAGTGMMHESFDMDDANAYTRPWLAWANTLFGELIARLYQERPHLLNKETGG